MKKTFKTNKAMQALSLSSRKHCKALEPDSKPMEKFFKDATEKPFSSEEHSGKQTHSPQSKTNVSRK